MPVRAAICPGGRRPAGTALLRGLCGHRHDIVARRVRTGRPGTSKPRAEGSRSISSSADRAGCTENRAAQGNLRPSPVQSPQRALNGPACAFPSPAGRSNGACTGGAGLQAYLPAPLTVVVLGTVPVPGGVRLWACALHACSWVSRPFDRFHLSGKII